MKSILQKILKFLARQVLLKYNPKIIGITGSVGKTSAKEAIYTILMNKFSVHRSIKSYNNEIGVPLTIIRKETAGKNILGWLFIFFSAIKLLFVKDQNYPQILILEMAADKPGDIDYLLSFVKPQIGVLTAIGPVHLEKFGTQEKIILEKSKLIKILPQNGFAVLNYDQKDVFGLCDLTRAKCIAYGFEEGADVRAENIIFNARGSNFTLAYNNESKFISLPHALGRPQIYAVLSAASVGIIFGLKLEDIKEAAKNYHPPQGRGNLIAGIKHTFIIDDTYNASPLSVAAALENLKKISDGRRSFAVLGDMLELGSVSQDKHQEAGGQVKELGVDYLLTLGARAKDIAQAAGKAGMNEDRIFEFSDHQSLGGFLQERLKEGDVVLVKGSRAMRMEKIVEEIEIKNRI